MREEIKKAVIALHELENVTIEEFNLLRVEIDEIENKVKETVCKKIFKNNVENSENIIMQQFIKNHKIETISFHKIFRDDEFISCVVFDSNEYSIGFHINTSDNPEFIKTNFKHEIFAYAMDSENVRANIGMDITYFTNGEIFEFLEFINSLVVHAYKYGLFVEEL